MENITEKSVLRKKKPLIIVISIVILLMIILFITIYYIGYENIKAAYFSLKYDDDKISTLLDENNQRLNDKVAEYSYIVAREPTKEELAAVNSGEINNDQLAKIIANGLTLNEYRENDYTIKPHQPDKTTTDNSNGSSQNGGNAENNAGAEGQSECDQKVSQIVAKMYILKSSFSSSLAGLLNQAYSEYSAGGSKSEIASKYLSQGQALEAQCDGNVSALMSELTGILKKYGRSTELVDTIYSSYASEKQYTKAYYMSMYLNK